ncbi:hypothetical protein HanRHA438_Chr06g0274961 [Helianthus annuus]|nr:hypothetical protein HanRHA438_Chr06g0274961 [Helianthus annuus]
MRLNINLLFLHIQSLIALCRASCILLDKSKVIIIRKFLRFGPITIMFWLNASIATHLA